MISRIANKDSRENGLPAICLLSTKELEQLQRRYRETLPLSADTETPLAESLNYVLRTPCSFFRAQLAYLCAKLSGATSDTAMDLGVAIEYFHSASLIFDDLPAMDDALQRRGAMCLHLAFSEADAILVALALINHAYGMMINAFLPLPPERAKQANEYLTRLLGLAGILNGQANDLHVQEASQQKIRSIAEDKNASLFKLSMSLSCLLGGADQIIVAYIDDLATTWGVSHQILDDLMDVISNIEESGKSSGRDIALCRPNLPLCIGEKAAWEELRSLLSEANEQLRTLIRRHPHWVALNPVQTALEDRYRHLRKISALPIPA